MTKEESLYQVKLILESLDFEDYKKIPDETWNYIENNMVYNENIVIDPDKPLEEQNIDEKAKAFLKEVLNQIDNYKEDQQQEQEYDDEIVELYKYSDEELVELIKKYKMQNEKMTKVKNLVLNYESALKHNSEEINKLKKTNNDLLQSIIKCPKVIRKLFFKDFESKLLN